MVTIDRSKLNAEVRNTPINPILEDFVLKVSLAKPLCEFSFAAERSVRTVYDYTKDPVEKSYELFKVEVHQDGELLGGLFLSERYVEGKKEQVYGVESFRIQKERGQGDATITKNIKVALRNAKKAFVSRADDELRQLIKDNVTQSLGQVWGQARNAVTYSMDTSAEALYLAMHAYSARKRGEPTCSVPSMPTTVKRPKEHDRECEEFVVSTFLKEQLDSKLGYGVKVFANGSLAVLNFSDMSITKYKAFEALPDDIQNRLAMFKVISANEPHSHLGCKFTEEMFYIVAGDMQLES
jgi:hypothetical protein